MHVEANKRKGAAEGKGSGFNSQLLPIFNSLSSY